MFRHGVFGAVFTAALTTASLGQVITIDNRGVHADGKTLRLETEIGSNGSDHAELTIINRSGHDIRYKVHTRERVIGFHPEDGRPGDLKEPFEGTLNTTDDTRDDFPFYIIKRTGRPGVVEESIGVDVWDEATDRHLGCAEVAVLATFRGHVGNDRPGPEAAGRPKGFEMLGEDDGHLCHCRDEHLPLRVYSNEEDVDGLSRAGARTARRAAEQAIDIFNIAARDMKHKPFFQLVPRERDADMLIDWSGDGLDPRFAGQAVHQRGSSRLVVKGVIMQSPNRKRHESFIAEDLAQELGHILGLGHSDDAHDLMGPHPEHRDTNGDIHALDAVNLTERDRQALSWLYRQDDFIPIVPRRVLR